MDHDKNPFIHPGPLKLKGCHNFRDLGGYHTKEGLTVKKGLLYRSDSLNRLNKKDMVYIRELGIKRIIDFRGDNEVSRKPDKTIEGIEYIRMPIDAAGRDRENKIKEFLRGKKSMDLHEYMVDTYREILKSFHSVYRDWLHQLLVDRSPVPQLFHCTAGKDRTGLAAAFFLRLLEVKEEDILNDYLQTNQNAALVIQNIVRKIRLLSFFSMDGEKLRPVLEVHQNYYRQAFHYINEHWGSWNQFVKEALEINQKQLSQLKGSYLTEL